MHRRGHTASKCWSPPTNLSHCLTGHRRACSSCHTPTARWSPYRAPTAHRSHRARALLSSLQPTPRCAVRLCVQLSHCHWPCRASTWREVVLLRYAVRTVHASPATHCRLRVPRTSRNRNIYCAAHACVCPMHRRSHTASTCWSPRTSPWHCLSDLASHHLHENRGTGTLNPTPTPLQTNLMGQPTH